MIKTQEKFACKTITCRLSRCMGCKSCEIACAVSHSEFRNVVEAAGAGAKLQGRVKVMPAGAHGVPLQCRHCEDAPCIMVCPTEAVHRTGDRGPVLIDEKRCIGCKMCLVVCPFGVIDLKRDGKAVVKCDLCIQRTKDGKEPACVLACPTKALKFVDLEEHNREKRKAAAKSIQDEADAGK